MARETRHRALGCPGRQNTEKDTEVYLDKISPEEGSQPEPDPDPAENPWSGREVSVSDHRVDRQQLLQHPPTFPNCSQPRECQGATSVPFYLLLLFIIYLFIFLLFIKNHFMICFFQHACLAEWKSEIQQKI